MTLTLTTLDAIEARKDTLVAEAEEILARAGDAALEGDDLARYTDIEAELDDLKHRKDRLERLARHRSAGTSGDGTTLQYMRRTDPYALEDRRYHGGDVKARAATALEQTRHLPDQYRTRVGELLERLDTVDGALARHLVVTGRPEYRSAWFKLVTGQQWALTPAEQDAVAQARAASLTNNAGGYAVPFTLDSSLILTSAGSTNPWRQIADVATIVTDDWNGVSTAGITASWDTEGTQVSDDAPTLAQPSISVHKAQAFVPFSVEVGMDWPGFEAEMRMAFADAKDVLESAAFATGSGSGQPKGVITALVAASSPIQASATTDTFAVADVYATLEKCPARHRPNGSWVANLSIINKMRQFATANNYHAFLTDLTADSPSKLLGKPLYESSDMDGSITGSADNYVLVFGNFKRYKIVDRVGMSVELVPHLTGANYRPTGQRGLWAYWRVGADCTDTSAFGLLNVT